MLIVGPDSGGLVAMEATDRKILLSLWGGAVCIILAQV